MSVHISCDMYLRLGLHVQIRLYYVLPYKAKISAQHGIGYIGSMYCVLRTNHAKFAKETSANFRNITEYSILSASKLLGIMRKLKFIVRRKTLNQIYLSFLRPILEYASVVWDNCTLYEKDNLEKLHIEAGRIVTGLTRSASLYNLYHELGWLTLSERRKYKLVSLKRSQERSASLFSNRL